MANEVDGKAENVGRPQQRVDQPRRIEQQHRECHAADQRRLDVQLLAAGAAPTLRVSPVWSFPFSRRLFPSGSGDDERRE